MIYDANTWIGHWPFRALPRTSAKDLLKQMDKHGIAKALVGTLHGLMYKDAHEANRELIKESRSHRDRLIPCAILNPVYGGWRDDLKQCREEFGMPVLRMVPDYHGYALSDPCAEEMIAAAHKLKMRVALYWRIVDPRGRHRLDPGREANAHVMEYFVKRFPQARFLMLNFRAMLNDKKLDKPACYYDITQFHGGGGLNLGRQIQKHGTDRFVFGTTMLLRYGKPACINLEKVKLTKRRREAIQWRNLARLVPEMK